MSVTTTRRAIPLPRTAVFVGGLVVALIAGFGLGKLTTPTPTLGASDPNVIPTHSHAPLATAGTEVGGLSISAGGYTLVPKSQNSFVINAANGNAVTSYATVYDKQLHLILVRRDLTGYQHVHPTMAPDGTWTFNGTFGAPGLWRAFADCTVVTPAGAQTALTLGWDITVNGSYEAKTLPAAARESTVDGHTVTYEGTPVVGATSPLLFRVPDVQLERYLGAFGHLVVLRQGDLGYVHVHPEAQLSGGAVKFWFAAPSPGTYRMFFDYQSAGVVHTAEFTLTVA
jgi:hypothetical protein